MNRLSGGAIVPLLFLLTAALSVVSCTKVDNTLGNDFIPDDQRMQIASDTIYGIDAYLAQQDSFPTTDLTAGAYIGALSSETFGKLKATAIVQFMWDAYSFEDLGAKFGTAPVVDSIKLFLSVSGFGGDTSLTQTFDVRRLKQRVYKDSSYYAGFDAEAIAEDEILCTFTIQGKEDVEVKMTGVQADRLAAELIDTTGGTYGSDSMFYKKFKGLYIAPAAGSPENASILTINLDESKLQLHTRNFTDATASSVKDTLTINYPLATTYGAPNVSVNTFTHDYTGTPVTGINDTLPTDRPVPVGYIEGLGGVCTYLRFDENFVAELKSKIVAPYKSMVINSARISFELADPDPETLEKTTAQLGMYRSLVGTISPIADYDISYEQQGGTLYFGGALNRTHNNYTMDISAYLQQIVNAPDTGARTMLLAPGSSYLYGFSNAVVKTPLNDPNDPQRMRVALTYTLIR